jgi:glutaconate CoA-transferase subunit A
MADRLELGALAARIPDGATLAIPADYAGVAMAATRALLRRRPRGLKLVTVPTSGLQADLLIGAGAVAEIETSGVTLNEHGLAPRFSAAAKAGTIRIVDATCPAIHAGLQASEKGVPFMPLRGLLGTDLMRQRLDWRTARNPFGGAGDDIVLLPAIRPDIALFHAASADRNGNVWIGRRRELGVMAHASAATLVTIEEFADADFMADEATAAGALPALYVTAVARAPRGAWPLRFIDRYPADDAELARYAEMARSNEGFAAYLRDALAAAA